ncbi:stress protein [Gynurincola endophyticus]|uniref:stress protein n=1 Tax=Gynurincola endophyticus TaxID=2479004 RepID=UPI000F8C691B|nr:stress protein [Gynurincola endophyticus]
MSINLQKITIKNQGDSHSIDLKKREVFQKEILINLNWSNGESKKGFLAGLLGRNTDIDLDLGCFYELNNGDKLVIDGLQFSKGRGGAKDRLTNQGRYTDRPWIWHTGDDRGSNIGSGENILINPIGVRDLKRVVVYCFIYDGVARWADTNAVVNIKVAGNPDVEVELGKQNSIKKFCAIAEIMFNPDSMNVKKLVTFHNSHNECDKAYSWGFRWTSGAK